MINEFTKQELQDIYEAVMDTDIAMFDYLPKKILSMIDNYCEHDFDMNNWTKDSADCRWYECKKCKGSYR